MTPIFLCAVSALEARASTHRFDPRMIPVVSE